jgi:tetratricopeptide (TPR) repeat protein
MDMRNKRQWYAAFLLCAGLTAAGGTASSDQGSEAGAGVPLYADLGTLHHAITTDHPKAQQYFDQGLRLVFAFNHEEAVNSFRQAIAFDEKAAMAWWGVALALGPNINAPMGPAEERRANDAVQRAKELSGGTTPKERAYIEALAARYSAHPETGRQERDRAYAAAMQQLWQRFPDDVDAGTLYAEALMVLQPWDFWRPDGQPKGQAMQIVTTLERVLASSPDHPGACHYYIHAVEASLQPERALPCAERLPSLVPGAGHLVHMPGHIYLRLGRYREAAERNVHAAAVDHEYLAHRPLQGIYPVGYYPHNVHFLWLALSMEGRSREAIEAAQRLMALVPWDKARHEPAAEEFTPTLLFALTRFGRWQETLDVPEPPVELLYTTAIWHYARGLSHAALGRVDEAAAEHQRLARLVHDMPEDRMIGLSSIASLGRIAEDVLAAELAARRGGTDEAVRLLRQAVSREDELRYYEPPLWHYPVRHALGALLLSADRPREAELVYREDLARHPENGWALFGLAASLKAQGQRQAAAAVEERFNRAWARADVRLTASRF